MVFDKLPCVGSLNSMISFESLVLSNIKLVDYYFFTYHVGDTFLCVLICVYDLLITDNSLSMVNKFKASLSTTFQIKDLGT